MESRVIVENTILRSPYHVLYIAVSLIKTACVNKPMFFNLTLLMGDPAKQYFAKFTASAFPEQSETGIAAEVSVFILERAALPRTLNKSGLSKYYPSAALSKPSSVESLPRSLKYKASINQTFLRLFVLINNKTKRISNRVIACNFALQR